MAEVKNSPNLTSSQVSTDVSGARADRSAALDAMRTVPGRVAPSQSPEAVAQGVVQGSLQEIISAVFAKHNLYLSAAMNSDGRGSLTQLGREILHYASGNADPAVAGMFFKALDRALSDAAKNPEYAAAIAELKA